MRAHETKPAVVYVATNILSGKKYIGVTTRSLESRKKGHFYHALRGAKTKFHRAIRKHGEENFEFVVLETLASMSVALTRERELIAKMKPEYNITVGGEGVLGNRHSKRVRAQLREKASSPHAIKLWHKYIGLGSKSMRQAIICVSTSKVYVSITAAARDCELAASSVASSCNGRKNAKTNGLQFRRLTEAECKVFGLPFKQRYKIKQRTKAFYTALKKRQKAIICTDDDQYFASVKDAFKYYGKRSTSSQISNAHIAISNGWRISGRLFAYAAGLRQ